MMSQIVCNLNSTQLLTDLGGLPYADLVPFSRFMETSCTSIHTITAELLRSPAAQLDPAHATSPLGLHLLCFEMNLNDYIPGSVFAVTRNPVKIEENEYILLILGFI